nr:hypothetical protein [uncultured Carboxylicivirga sp.]
MNIFKRIFKTKKNIEKSSDLVIEANNQIETTFEEAKSEKIDETQYIKLAKLLIESDNNEIIEKYKVKLNHLKTTSELIFDDGEYYFDTQNNEFQVYRGDSKEIKDNIEWFLLIDTLGFNRILWELDWKTGPEETNSILKSLSDFKNYNLPDLGTINSEGMKSLDEYFRAVNNVLEKAGFVAINLYIDSDSYITGLIKIENLKSIIGQADKCLQRISKYE